MARIGDYVSIGCLTLMMGSCVTLGTYSCISRNKHEAQVEQFIQEHQEDIFDNMICELDIPPFGHPDLNLYESHQGIGGLMADSMMGNPIELANYNPETNTMQMNIENARIDPAYGPVEWDSDDAHPYIDEVVRHEWGHAYSDLVSEFYTGNNYPVAEENTFWCMSALMNEEEQIRFVAQGKENYDDPRSEDEARTIAYLEERVTETKTNCYNELSDLYMTLFVSEGIAQYFTGHEAGDYTLPEHNIFDIGPYDTLDLIYEGGAEFVKPILDVDVEMGTLYLIENPPNPHDWSELDEYQTEAIKRISGNY